MRSFVSFRFVIPITKYFIYLCFAILKKRGTLNRNSIRHAFAIPPSHQKTQPIQAYF